mgnify:CR=1 FL=1
MQWFNNLKIAKKLVLCFGILLVLTAFIGFYSLNRLGNVNTSAADIKANWLPSIVELGKIDQYLNAYRRYELQHILSNSASDMEKYELVTKAQEDSLQRHLEAYKPLISSEKERDIFNSFEKNLEEYKTLNRNMFALSRQNKKEEATTLSRGDEKREFDEALAALNEDIELNNNGGITEAENGSALYENARTSIYFVLAVSIILGLIIAIWLANKISKPISLVSDRLNSLNKLCLTNLQNGAERFAEGDMNIKIEVGTPKLNIDSKDETGMLAESLNSIIDKTQASVTAVENVTHTVVAVTEEISVLVDSAVNGKLSIRGNSEKFKGGYKDIINGINQTLDAVIGPLNVAAEYVDRISKGDIPSKITEQYHGDFNEIKNNLNVCIDAINSMIKDVNLLSKAAYDGELKTRADESAHSGDFRKIVAGLNTTLDTVTGPLNAATKYMNAISKGNLPEPIGDDYKGDYAEIKTAINELIHSSDLIFRGIRRISMSIVDGNLDDRGNSARVPGGWGALVDNINDVINVLVSHIKLMGASINNISKGNIPDIITKEYKGDFELIKNDLNTCSISIKDVIDDINELAEAAVDGKLNIRADASKHNGDFRKIVEGVNNTLEAVVTPIKSTANYIAQLKAGSLTDTIKDEFKGDFNEVKDNLNGLISTIDQLALGIGTVTKEILNGNLEYVGKPEAYTGTWFKVANGITSMIIALREPIRFMEANIQKISAGNIPEQITDDYKGEFNEVKVNLNACFDSINALIEDMKTLSDNAVNGRLKDRADVSKHKGDFGKIILGVNNTLDAVLTPVTEGVAVLGKMAQGDFTIKITSDYKGDHRLIKDSINTVVDSLNNTLGKVTEAVAATASASNQISSSTEEMAAGANEQTRQTTEVAGGVEEMTRTIVENTKNVTLAADNAKDAGQKAREGGKVVNETIEGMNKIAEVVRKSAQTVQALGKSSDQIGEIVQVIDDIADQTNLLALNAAIEAARAGEQGRGFAVVADEVRKLAERTTKATKEIATMIKQIQRDTTDAVDSMEEGTAEVEKGKLLANRAGGALEEIVEGSQQVLDIVSQVAAASEQQSTAAEQISRNVEAISSVSQETAAGTLQIAKAAEDLSKLTLNLEDLIDQFKIMDSSKLIERSVHNAKAINA